MSARRWLPVALVLVVLVLGGVGTAGGQELDLGGTVSGEFRLFPEAPLVSDQLDTGQPSLLLEPELRFRSGDRRHRFVLEPFLRVDGVDTERTHFDLREAHWLGVFGDWEVTAGITRVFWGVTESRHLVDVINQTDLVEEIDEEDKLGQPMLRVAWQRPWGRLTGLVLFGFRERTLPGRDGRLRPPFEIDVEKALYPDGRRAVDLALRYSHYFGPVDLGLHLFHGTGREPAFVPDAFGDDALPVLRPLYRTISQAGLDVQLTRDATLWKLEALVRGGEGKTFAALVAGLEHTFYQLGDSVTDVGVLAELLYDGRDPTAPPTVLQRDLFVGTRIALNDVRDTTLLAGVLIDLEDGSLVSRIEFERRLRQEFSLEVESWVFARAPAGDPIASFRNDTFVATRLTYAF